MNPILAEIDWNEAIESICVVGCLVAFLYFHTRRQ